ncbi:hypothetical protein AFLA70_94g002861 [Aspergillus flavus AF70]|nr:hypothetical protein AFLA70_94g002861 [Aspergillus flavus AF70]
MLQIIFTARQNEPSQKRLQLDSVLGAFYFTSGAQRHVLDLFSPIFDFGGSILSRCGSELAPLSTHFFRITSS